MFHPNPLLYGLRTFFYKIWFRCYMAMFSPWRFPDKWPGFPVGDNIRIRPRISSKVVLPPGSHASGSQPHETAHVTLYQNQISGPYAVFPWNSSYISSWASQMLPAVAGNTQFLLLPGCSMSYNLQAHIWRLCMDLAASRSLCLDLHVGFFLKPKQQPLQHSFVKHLSDTYSA